MKISNASSRSSLESFCELKHFCAQNENYNTIHTRPHFNMAFLYQKPAAGFLSLSKSPMFLRSQIRTFANVVEGQTSRQAPQPRQRQTPASYDTANFTIRNGPVFNGRSFGAKSNVSGEAVFTTSLVG